MLKDAEGSVYHHQQLVLSLSFSKESVSSIIQDVGSSNVCARWVSRKLTGGHKTVRKAISSESFACLKLRERPSYSRLLQMERGAINLSLREKDSP
jgi:hypothetical protein